MSKTEIQDNIPPPGYPTENPPPAKKKGLFQFRVRTKKKGGSAEAGKGCTHCLMHTILCMNEDD